MCKACEFLCENLSWLACFTVTMDSIFNIFVMVEKVEVSCTCYGQQTEHYFVNFNYVLREAVERLVKYWVSTHRMDPRAQFTTFCLLYFLFDFCIQLYFMLVFIILVNFLITFVIFLLLFWLWLLLAWYTALLRIRRLAFRQFHLSASFINGGIASQKQKQ